MLLLLTINYVTDSGKIYCKGQQPIVRSLSLQHNTQQLAYMIDVNSDLKQCAP
jgi:hypothetical protein